MRQIEIGCGICDLLLGKLLEIEKVFWEKDIVDGRPSYRLEDILYSTFEKIDRLNAQVKEYLRFLTGRICFIMPKLLLATPFRITILHC
jgi:hypothetical protein